MILQGTKGRQNQLQYFFPIAFQFLAYAPGGTPCRFLLDLHCPGARPVGQSYHQWCDLLCFCRKKNLHEMVLVPCHLLTSWSFSQMKTSETFSKTSLTNLWALKFVCCGNNFDCSTFAVPLVQSFSSCLDPTKSSNAAIKNLPGGFLLLRSKSSSEWWTFDHILQLVSPIVLPGFHMTTPSTININYQLQDLALRISRPCMPWRHQKNR